MKKTLFFVLVTVFSISLVGITKTTDQALASGFVYTRTPGGDPVAPPIDLHIEGVFGTDFCTNPSADQYTIWLFDGAWNLYAAPYHYQGESVNETFTVEPPPGSYDVRLICNSGGPFGSWLQTTTLESGMNVVPATPVITSPGSVMSPKVVNTAYPSTTVSVSGGTAPYSFDVSSGALPTGLTLDAGTGAISGTPTAVGTFGFTIRVTDSNMNTGTQATVITIASPSSGFSYMRTPAGNPINPPATIHVQGIFGIDFCPQLSANQYSIWLFDGAWHLYEYPNQYQGEYVDRTTDIDFTPGTYEVRLICNTGGPFGTWLQVTTLDTITINAPAPTITTTTLPDANVGTAYSQTIAVSDGATPLTWTLVSGSLPANLSLGSSTGAISGTPSAFGASSFIVQVTDANSNVATKSLSLVVHGIDVVSLSASADTYLKQGSPNKNQGTESLLNIQQTGKHRALIQFDQAAIASAVGTGTLISATLQTHIDSNGHNWGGSGRTIDVDRMLHSWTETGATWNCSLDTNTSNGTADCSGGTAWNMDNTSTYSTTPTDTYNITNGLSGTISYNVTSDVSAYLANTATNYGWLIKKTNEGASGQISFDSKETANDPVLVLTVQH